MIDRLLLFVRREEMAPISSNQIQIRLLCSTSSLGIACYLVGRRLTAVLIVTSKPSIIPGSRIPTLRLLLSTLLTHWATVQPFGRHLESVDSGPCRSSRLYPISRMYYRINS